MFELLSLSDAGAWHKMLCVVVYVNMARRSSRHLGKTWRSSRQAHIHLVIGMMFQHGPAQLSSHGQVLAQQPSSTRESGAADVSMRAWVVIVLQVPIEHHVPDAAVVI